MFAVLHSGGLCFDGPVVPAREEQVIQVLIWMWRVLDNVFASLEAVTAIDFFQRGHGIDTDCFYAIVVYWAVSVPHQYTITSSFVLLSTVVVVADQAKSPYGLPQMCVVGLECSHRCSYRSHYWLNTALWRASAELQGGGEVCNSFCGVEV